MMDESEENMTTKPPAFNPEVSTPVSLFGHDKTKFGSSKVVIAVFVCGTLLALVCYAVGQLAIYLYRKYSDSQPTQGREISA